MRDLNGSMYGRINEFIQYFQLRANGFFYVEIVFKNKPAVKFCSFSFSVLPHLSKYRSSIVFKLPTSFLRMPIDC